MPMNTFYFENLKYVDKRKATLKMQHSVLELSINYKE